MPRTSNRSRASTYPTCLGAEAGDRARLCRRCQGTAMLRSGMIESPQSSLPMEYTT